MATAFPRWPHDPIAPSDLWVLPHRETLAAYQELCCASLTSYHILSIREIPPLLKLSGCFPTMSRGLKWCPEPFLGNCCSTSRGCLPANSWNRRCSNRVCFPFSQHQKHSIIMAKERFLARLPWGPTHGRLVCQPANHLLSPSKWILLPRFPPLINLSQTLC